MAHLTTEMIWHFAGYLHLQELLNLSSIRYSGAPQYTTTGYTAENYDAPDNFEVDWPTSLRPVRININTPQARVIEEDSPVHIEAQNVRIAISSPSAALSDIFFFNPTPPSNNLTPPQFPFEPLTVSVTYTIGESQYHDIYGKQSNHIIDDDVIFGGEEMLLGLGKGVGAPHNFDVEDRLADLIETAESHVPVDVLQSFDHPGNITRIDLDSDDVILPNLKGGSDDVPLIDVEGSGHYVNGELVDGPGDEMDAQFDQINAAIALVTERDSTSDERDEDDDSEPSFSEVITFLPPSDSSHIANLGGNDTVNAAFLYDFSESLTSRIIRGDYYETNAIIQINVLHDVDDINISGATLVEQLASGNNRLKNEATFVNDPGELYGDATRGVPGATDWEVDYVIGDFFDVSTQIQRNYLFDNDLSYDNVTHGQYFLETGDDGQLNITQLLELGSGYDLIIIAGDYYKYNAVVQTNVILDDDAIYKITSNNGDGSQRIDTGGNTLINDAAIYNIGGAKFDPLSENAEELADAIANRTEEFDYALAIGLPGDGDGVFEVLYVTGDYYNYNLLFQTNVIADVDALHQITDANEGKLLDASSSSGQNTAINAAAIVDFDSQSDYQFLDGESYEESVLVQANIITDDAPIDETNGAHDDLVATIAALSGKDDSSEDDEQRENAGPGGTGEVDLIGGILA